MDTLATTMPAFRVKSRRTKSRVLPLCHARQFRIPRLRGGLLRTTGVLAAPEPHLDLGPLVARDASCPQHRRAGVLVAPLPHRALVDSERLGQLRRGEQVIVLVGHRALMLPGIAAFSHAGSRRFPCSMA